LSVDALVIGGGLAGLCCAKRLSQAGLRAHILEASQDVGGRAQTDSHEGFLLDRGFQVLLTAYPEAQRMLDLQRLDLHRFQPGAVVRWKGRFHHFADPWRQPRHALATALSPIATLRDKLRIDRFRRRVCRGSLEDVYQRPERSTLAALNAEGFSPRVIESFFRPFLGGVFLDSSLETSSRMLEFVFRMFASGDAALPAGGMGAMAKQLAAGLPAGTLSLGTPVEKIERGAAYLQGGERREARAIVVATDGLTAAQLLNKPLPPAARGVTCLYYAAPRPPIAEPALVLNGDGNGPINNLCVPSQVAPSYAPPGQALVSVSALGCAQGNRSVSLESEVRDQLRQWYGQQVDAWRLLKIYPISYALPRQAPPALSPVEKPAQPVPGIFVCGDHCDTASIQGAMASARRATEAVQAHLAS
jgi:phytoene dehydrogenase-like protein